MNELHVYVPYTFENTCMCMLLYGTVYVFGCNVTVWEGASACSSALLCTQAFPVQGI